MARAKLPSSRTTVQDADRPLVVGRQKGFLHVRRRTKGSWTPAKEDKFLIALAQTCNVTLAAKAAGMSKTSAYDRRLKDKGFRGAWEVAVGEAYAALERLLLERAIKGDRKPVFYAGTKIATVRDYPDRIALALYAHYGRNRAVGSTAMTPEDVDEARAKLAKRLKLIRYHAEAGDHVTEPAPDDAATDAGQAQNG